MANIILTTNCQRNCDYCFAKNDRDKNEEITWESFVEAAAFIRTSQVTVNVLGGEPTLHKDFCKMIEYLLVNDFIIQVFTNGMLSSKVLEDLNKVLNRTVLRKDQLYFAVNINEEKYRSEEENRKQKRFLSYMGHLTYPSFTIQDENVNLMFLKDLIYEFGMDKNIRLGLALPTIGIKNKFLDPKYYRNAAENIIELANDSEGIRITFDCGFPMCMFTIEEIGELSKNKENDFAFICGQPLDIHPNLTMSNCYPLSMLHRTPISGFKTIEDAYTYFEYGFMTPTGIYDKCRECTFFRKLCWGGCKGFYEGVTNEEDKME